MSATTTAPAVRAGSGPADPRRAMVALARVEATRLLRHPVVLAGLLLFIAPELYGWLSGRANRFPILPEEDWSKQFLALLLLGGGALIAANLAALRPHRHATTPLYDTLALPPSWRTGAALLSVVPFAALVAVLVVVRIGLLAALPGAAGRPSPAELAVAPAAVLLLGALGVLLARLARTVIVAPLSLLTLAVATFAGVLSSLPGAARLRWLLPVALEEPAMPLPAALMTRPSGWHLAYLAGLIVVAAVAVLAVAGARGRRVTVAGAGGLAVAVVAGVVQLLPASAAVRDARARAERSPAQTQTCRRIDQVTYCAFADFVPWIGGWESVVRGVLRAVPPAQAGQPLTVRQRVSTVERMADGQVMTAEQQTADTAAWRRIEQAAGTPNAVTAGTRWGDDESEVRFAGMVAYEVVTRDGAPSNGLLCGARGILVAWLAGQATPRAAAGLRQADAASFGAVPFGEPELPVGFSVPDRSMVAVSALLRRPAAEVAAVVERSWAELSAARTSAERAAELFGVTLPPLPPVEERDTCER